MPHTPPWVQFDEHGYSWIGVGVHGQTGATEIAKVYDPEDAKLILTAVNSHSKLLGALKSPTWLVWSNEHAAWWGPNGRGYYTDIGAAGRYTLEEAIRITGLRGSSQKASETGNPGEMIQPSPEWIAARAAAIAKAEGGGQ